MTQLNDVSGTAALAICESLLLALYDRKILPESEIVGILKDAAAAHHHASTEDDRAALHVAVAALLESILAGGNSVRRQDTAKEKPPAGDGRDAAQSPKPLHLGPSKSQRAGLDCGIKPETK